MAAGAIPPPLFFEQRRPESILAPAHGILKNAQIFKNTLQIRPEQTQRRSHHLNGRRAPARPPER